MLRPEPRPRRSTVSDRELGVASLLLFVAVVLTALVVPWLA